MRDVIGPNANLSRDLLSPRVLLCCGEDASEFLGAVERIGGQPYREYSAYRCYQFWRFDDFLAGWTGIGTGCLEPLVFELLATRQVARLALVGTAGRFAHSLRDLSQVHLCDPATCRFTGLDRWIGETLLRPKLPSNSADTNLPRAAIVSTDLYYGFSQQAIHPSFPLYSAALEQIYRDGTSNMDFVDMEVGQFYYLCDKFGGEELEAYFACKGAANDMGEGQQQLDNSVATIESCVQAALRLLIE